ncbi:hypothetical protein [Micromonospora carbonacea]|uniref:hypothetical protein n=1 Tax=Micromonospora carbonacea TaxID=47853 RepID=UPI003D70AED7
MTNLLDWITHRLTPWMTGSGLLALASAVWILSARDGVDWGDTPAWAAFGVSLAGTTVALHAAQSSRSAARSAEISAKAGVRQAAAAEEQVAIAREALKLAEQQSKTSGTPVHAGPVQEALTQKTSYVAWWLDRRGKTTFSLRNIGNDTARGVNIDRSRIPCMVRIPPHPNEIPPGASIMLQLIPSFGAPQPSEIWVRWDGHLEWKAVPVP